MKTITEQTRAGYRIKGSKFLGYLCPAQTGQNVQDILDTVKSEHPNATHHCYAYRINPKNVIEFSQDDGEPSGTAGLPILNQLRAFGVINALLVVVRYYGGTKLGKSGLTEAYGHTAHLCLDSAALKKVLPVKLYRVEYDYPHQGLIDQLKNRFTILQRSSAYLEHVSLEFGCPEIESQQLERCVEPYRHLFKEWKPMGDSFHIVE